MTEFTEARASAAQTRSRVEEALQLAAEFRTARAALEAATDDIVALLHPAISAWNENAPCGQTGGWVLDTEDGAITEDGEVHLIHECFYAHRYDRDVAYRTTVPLQRLLA